MWHKGTAPILYTTQYLFTRKNEIRI